MCIRAHTTLSAHMHKEISLHKRTEDHKTMGSMVRLTVSGSEGETKAETASKSGSETETNRDGEQDQKLYGQVGKMVAHLCL